MILRCVLVLLVFGAMLILTAPAKLAANLMVKGVNFSALDFNGGLWHGEATKAQLVFNGNVLILQSVQWRMKILSWLKLQRSADMILTLEQGQVEAELFYWGPENISAKNVIFNFPSSALLGRMSDFDIGGKLDGRLSEVKIQRRRLSHLDGKLWWRDAEISLAGNHFELGDIALRVRHVNGRIVISNLGTDSTLHIDLTIDVQSSSSINVIGQIRPILAGAGNGPNATTINIARSFDLSQ